MFFPRLLRILVNGHTFELGEVFVFESFPFFEFGQVFLVDILIIEGELSEKVFFLCFGVEQVRDVVFN